MTGAFIVVTLGVSIVSRVWRSTELRFGGFTLRECGNERGVGQLVRLGLPDPGADPRRRPHARGKGAGRIRHLATGSRRSMPIMFILAEVNDASDFLAQPGDDHHSRKTAAC